MSVFEDSAKIIIRDRIGSVGFLKLVEVGADRKEIPVSSVQIVDGNERLIGLSNGVSSEIFEFCDSAQVFNITLGNFNRKALKAYVCRTQP